MAMGRIDYGLMDARLNVYDHNLLKHPQCSLLEGHDPAHKPGKL